MTLQIVADSYGPVQPQQFDKLAGWIRYCPGTNIDPRKACKAWEVDICRQHNFPLVLCGERGTQDWRGGYDAGARDGEGYRNAANSIGYSSRALIYATADTDVGPGDVSVLMEYCRGFNAGIGMGVGGLYADGLALRIGYDGGFVKYPWQTESDGFHGSSTVYGNCVLHQRTTHKLPVTGIDESDVLHPDWGQANYTPPVSVPVEVQEDTDVLADVMIAHVAGADGKPVDARRWVLEPGMTCAVLVESDAVLKETIAQCTYRGGKVYERPCSEEWIDAMVKRAAV